jgi:hypothetical protein
MVETTLSGISDDDKPVTIGADGSVRESQGGGTEPPSIGGFRLIDPGELGDSGSGGAAPKKRGRPKGWRKSVESPASETPKNLIANIESLLLSVHFMGAKLLEVPELELDEEEAKKLADAIRRVAEFYPVALSPKKLAWAEFSFAMAGVYGPRVIAIYKKAPKQQPGPRAVPRQQAQSQAQSHQPVNHPGPSQAATPRPLTSASAPRVPSEMWPQSGNEVDSDQA